MGLERGCPADGGTSALVALQPRTACEGRLSAFYIPSKILPVQMLDWCKLVRHRHPPWLLCPGAGCVLPARSVLSDELGFASGAWQVKS